MPTFTDTQSREWNISLFPPDVLGVREACDPHFMYEDGKRDHTYLRLDNDPVLLSQVLHALTESQRRERGIADNNFYAGIIGDALDSGLTAIREAMAAVYSPANRVRLEKMVAVKQKLDEAILARINNTLSDAQLTVKVDDMVDKAFADIGVTETGENHGQT